MLSHMLYVSRTTLDWTVSELEELVAYAQQRNAKDGLTGLLLYGRGHFVQLLEGRRQPLVLTFDRIARDPRHTEVEVLLDGPIPKRLFDGWAMGLVNVEQAGEIDRDRFDRVIASFARAGAPAPRNEVALALLREFKAHASARAVPSLPELS